MSFKTKVFHSTSVICTMYIHIVSNKVDVNPILLFAICILSFDKALIHNNPQALWP